MRSWREEDLEPFAALNADPIVMEFFPSTLTRQESDALVARITAQLDTLGYGLWALEIAETGEFIGFTGLAAADVPRALHSVGRGRMAARAFGVGSRLRDRSCARRRSRMASTKATSTRSSR